MKVIVSACLLGLMLSGCAFGNRQAALDYPPPAETEVVSSAQASTAPASRGVIYLAGFEDLRPDKDVVGHVQNGFGMKTADVIAQREIPEWVQAALTYELEAAGYSVDDAEAAPSDATTLSGDVIRVYCSAYFAFDGEVTLRVEANKAGETLLDRSYSGTGSAGANFAATGDGFSESLSLALRAALQQVIAELAKLET